VSKVLHIGAAAGEIDFYSSLGVCKLVYAEPDKLCLHTLKTNIGNTFRKGSSMEIIVVPKACSSVSGQFVPFYANGSGQSSLEKPESQTLELVGNSFDQYSVETISLVDLKTSNFGNEKVDYLCIDTQGHEKAIICSTRPEFLGSNFSVIDIELMTDPGQYAVDRGNWIAVVQHLLLAGFEPLVHPHGITESYIFVNSLMNMKYYIPVIGAIRDRHMKEFFALHSISVSSAQASIYSSLGDHMFLPLTHIGGSIHASKLQSFREDFISWYLQSIR